MKKILIVNNNMEIGGVQKSLHNLLWSIDTVNEYDVTLLLFSKSGEYAKDLPESVKVVECNGPFRYLGKSQSEYRRLKDKLFRGAFAVISKLFSGNFAMRLMTLFEPMHKGEYDCAISFFHNGRKKAFYGGTQNYVLNCVKAKRKIAFLHCDYNNCGANHKSNNRLIGKFDKIAACSDGCRYVLEGVLPDLKERCVTVKNCHRFDFIRQMSKENPVLYDKAEVNIIMVARLSHEKGIDRGIRAVAYLLEKGLKVKLHIVGDGAEKDSLQELAKSLGLLDHIVFYSCQSNPYRYMKNADLFLLTSYHEAAPMVIDEARCLGVPVLTTETTSSEEMVNAAMCGTVCENSQEALNRTLFETVLDKQGLYEMKERLLTECSDNSKALIQFKLITEN